MSPTPTKYPNAGRRETGVAAALIPTNYNDDGDDEATCTSFNGPYADSDDDIGNAFLLHHHMWLSKCYYNNNQDRNV